MVGLSERERLLGEVSRLRRALREREEQVRELANRLETHPKGEEEEEQEEVEDVKEEEEA